MATYTVDKIAYGGNTYNLQDASALQLTGGSVTGPVTFGDSVSVDDLSVGTLSTTGNATFANNIQVNKINNVTVGSSPKFTDTITTVSTTGSGNAITAITASNGAITATKGSTFVTSADIPTAGTTAAAVGTTASGGSATTWSKSDHVHNITSSTITSALGYTPYNSTNPSGYVTTDENVKQTNTTTNSDYRIIFSGSANDTTLTEGVRKSDTITFNPSTGRLNLNSNSTATTPSLYLYNTSDYMSVLTGGSCWFCSNATNVNNATAAIRFSQNGNKPYLMIRDGGTSANSYLYKEGIDKINNIGTITTNSFIKSSVASGTSLVSLGTFSIPVGSYMVFVTVYFPSMGTGKRVCMDVSGTGVPQNTADVRASSGTTNYLKCYFAITCSSATTITVKGYQNSGSSLNLTVNYQYIRVA